ncbi:hypothetical protein HY496_00430 [Candidatus Woesearchaeota archaeon]|nr:hypothetical protein [Candidatus Woesearchaeota archaeon]
MVNVGVKAQCRVCGLLAPADEFRLHYKFKQAVCARCYSGRTEQEKQKEELKKKKEEIARPPGWDEVDEYLTKTSQQRREEQQMQFSKIPGTDQVKCLCFHCKYSFKYDALRKLPVNCPYCNTEVPRLRDFNSL